MTSEPSKVIGSVGNAALCVSAASFVRSVSLPSAEGGLEA